MYPSFIDYMLMACISEKRNVAVLIHEVSLCTHRIQYGHKLF
jgi:hypothetical protein